MKIQRRMLFLLTIIIQTIALSGCSFNGKNMVCESTEVFTEDVTHVMTYEDPNGKKEQEDEKIIWNDLDGNGEDEYFVINNEYNGILSLYFNNELIYQYTENDMFIVGIGEKEYIDLDNDGEKEIFVSFSPSVNSMPLEEWFVLKQMDSGWELLEMYHQNNDMTQNAFPISISLKEKEFLFSITCDGCEKEIIYDATAHYEKMELDSYLIDTYKAFVDSDFKVGDEVGSTSAWGIWDINPGICQDKNCLIAQHGINGAGGKYDFLGCIEVYFNYDNSGKICILDIVFEEADFT